MTDPGPLGGWTVTERDQFILEGIRSSLREDLMTEWSGTFPKCNHVPAPAPTRLCVMHEARDQAIRDCIAAVEFLYHHNTEHAAVLWAAICELRALLDKP